jgi:hypothetical protein
MELGRYLFDVVQPALNYGSDLMTVLEERQLLAS